MTVKAIPATEAHIIPVAEGMRESDIQEITASFGVTPLVAVTESFKCSPLCWTIMQGEEVIGMFGVGSDGSERGSPWLLATPALEDSGMTFLRQSRSYVQKMLRNHSFLENWVDARNLVSIKWLKWCGFEFDEPRPFGVEQRPFLRFEMRR